MRSAARTRCPPRGTRERVDSSLVGSQEGQEFDRAVWEECERLTAAASEQADAANSVAEANKKRYDDQAVVEPRNPS